VNHATAAPVLENERAEILDILRGFALLGIFIAHVPGLAGWDYLAPTEHAAVDLASDSTLQFLREMWIRSKFYSLFSLLFGFGFSIQYASARRRGTGFSAQFRRRQFGLLALGVLHSAFWHGDILLTYALLGLALIPFASWEPRRIFRWALGALAMRAAWGLLMWSLAGALGTLAGPAVGDGAGSIDVNTRVREVMAGYYSSDWTELLLSNARFLRWKWGLVLYQGKLFSIAGFFLLGVALGKWRVHERIAELEPELRRVVLLFGSFGVAGNFVLAALWARVETFPPSALGAITNLLYAAAVPALAIAIAAGIALLWIRGTGRTLLSAFAAPGRMALTTYLSQTAIGLGLFYGVGLGLRGTFSLTGCIATALVVFALQMVVADWWLKSFQYGPIEWLWRCFTYRRALPILRSRP